MVIDWKIILSFVSYENMTDMRFLHSIKAWYNKFSTLDMILLTEQALNLLKMNDLGFPHYLNETWCSLIQLFWS